MRQTAILGVHLTDTNMVDPNCASSRNGLGTKQRSAALFCKFWTKKTEKVNKVEDDEFVDFTPSKNL